MAFCTKRCSRLVRCSSMYAVYHSHHHNCIVNNQEYCCGGGAKRHNGKVFGPVAYSTIKVRNRVTGILTKITLLALKERRKITLQKMASARPAHKLSVTLLMESFTKISLACNGV